MDVYKALDGCFTPAKFSGKRAPLIKNESMVQMHEDNSRPAAWGNKQAEKFFNFEIIL
jgi:hypothetical protein